MAKVRQGILCLVCYRGKLWKPEVFYGVFKEHQPDLICNNCGTPFWKHQSPYFIKRKRKRRKNKHSSKLSPLKA